MNFIFGIYGFHVTQPIVLDGLCSIKPRTSDHRQAEEWGNLAMLTKPKWLIEGMAYTLSNDPRPKLSPPFEQWRVEFKSWYRYHHQDLWQASKRIKSD